MFTPKALNTPRSRVGASRLKASKNDSFSHLSTTPVRGAPTLPSHHHHPAPSHHHPAPSSAAHNLTQSFTTGTSLHQLDSYGGILPVLVTELITYPDKNASASVKLETHGWASLVMGNKLLVWKYKPSTSFSKTPQCVELNLPPLSQSEQGYTSSLVTLLPGERGEDQPSCLVVSPEGVVRYWHTTAHSGAFSDVAVDIKDEHFVSVIAVDQKAGPVQYVAGGNNSTLYLLTVVAGQVKWRLFQKPHGMLKGISRRMSSFIFGSLPVEGAPGGAAKLQALIGGEIMEEGGEGSIYVLSGPNLQKWCIVGETEKMLYQQNVERILGESIGQGVWKTGIMDLPNLKVWLLDIQLVGDAVIVLGAAYNPDVSNQVHYGVGSLHTEGVDPPQSFLSFSIPQYTDQYEEFNNSWLKMRLMLPDSNRWNVYLYDSKSVVCTSVTNAHQPIDKVDFTSPGDKLLGGGICDKSALFFSNVHGVVTIRDMAAAGVGHSVMADESRLMDSQTSMMSPEQSYMEEELSCTVSDDKIHEMSMSDDSLQRLKAAFLHYVRGHMAEAQTLIDALFSGGARHPDMLVLNLSQEMIDDIPSRDPRWAEKAQDSTSLGSGSLILMHQLDDKLKAHEYFIKFLKTVALWEKLTTVPTKVTPQVTRLLLCEHAEKIVTAKALREMHIQHETLVNSAIQKVMSSRGGSELNLMNIGGLTAHDLFYRKVSKIEDVFLQLVLYEEECLSQNQPDPKDTYDLISAVNNTTYNSMFAAYQYRITKSVVYEVEQQPLAAGNDFIPWTALPGPQGIREVMKRQHNIAVNQGLSEARDQQEKENLYQQIMEMADMILDGYKIQLEAMKHTPGGADSQQNQSDAVKMYQQQRSELISPFIAHDQYERAASLAEKYCDFSILIQICELTQNEERLQRYMDQFQNRGFPDYVFRWYIDEGKRGKLMASSLVSHPQLSHFLQSGNNKFMSWLNDVNSSDFMRAHYTLMELANQEEEFLGRKKTLLSLSKLSALASSEGENLPTENIRDINIKQDLLLHQEQLPKDILENLGIGEVETMKVLTPAKLIELYVSEYNATANEFDFKKALDLLQYVQQGQDPDDPESHEALILMIWCRAILRDNWGLINTHDLLEDIKDTIFFKTVEMAHADEEINLRQFLPNVDVLLGSDLLEGLKNDKKFEYLIRAGFEQIHRLL